jgi:4a-hydroxytetrahydrobiopterin dehydratase
VTVYRHRSLFSRPSRYREPGGAPDPTRSRRPTRGPAAAEGAVLRDYLDLRASTDAASLRDAPRRPTGAYGVRWTDEVRTYRCGQRTRPSGQVSAASALSMLLNMAVLTDEQVDAALPELNGWERSDGALRRSIKFPAFLDGIDAVRRVAEHAESKDHHPDIDIRWRTVTFALVTHSEGGITQNDIDMARDIDGIVGS